jgi:hypothetical protein
MSGLELQERMAENTMLKKDIEKIKKALGI